MTKEHKEKISKALLNRKITQGDKISKSQTGKKYGEKTKQKHRINRLKRKEKLGYINSPDAREKLSETWKQKWKKGEVTENQRNTLFKKGFDKKRIKTQFKKGHSVNMKTRLAVKKNRATQVFPKKDSRIEIKIQNYLKTLRIDFFTHQYMKDIEHGYQCDIWVPSMELIIECDGDYWHKYPEGRNIDHIRTKELIDKGFKVLRLWENEIKVMDLNKFKKALEET